MESWVIVFPFWVLNQLTQLLSPLLFSLCMNDCTSKDPSVKLLKFADDTTLIGHIQDGDESAHRQEDKELAVWCSLNNLELNTLSVDDRGLQENPPFYILTSFASWGSSTCHRSCWNSSTLHHWIRPLHVKMVQLNQIRRQKTTEGSPDSLVQPSPLSRNSSYPEWAKRLSKSLWTPHIQHTPSLNC